MIIATSERIAGHRIVETLGIARGGSVRSRNAVSDISNSLKSVIGGELSGYTEMQAHTREQALQRMMEDAEKMGANAIVAVRFDASSITVGATEINAYGTAVKIQPEA